MTSAVRCPVSIHHGPGHQSRTHCQVVGPHKTHEANYGSWGGWARWRGGDIFGDDDDEVDWTEEEDEPMYVSDMKWYQNDTLIKYSDPTSSHFIPPKNYVGQIPNTTEENLRKLKREVEKLFDIVQAWGHSSHYGQHETKCKYCTEYLDAVQRVVLAHMQYRTYL